jgi:peptidoglycan L-alanyl-D-glutamate endopeptidase CwlK
LYSIGNTTIKTYGAHYYRVAFDLEPIEANGKIDWTGKSILWKQCVTLGQSLGLEAGGAWTSFRDLPHYQYLGGVPLSQYRLGKRPAWYKPHPFVDSSPIVLPSSTISMPDQKEEDMTVAEFATLYKQMLAEQHGDDHAEYASEAINNAKAHGLFEGDGKGNYEWGEPVTRQELATVLYRVLKLGMP